MSWFSVLVTAADVLAKIPRATTKTKDITGGLPPFMQPQANLPRREYAGATLLTGAALVVALVGPGGAQRQTFTTTTDLVTLGVTVLDRNRQPVRGLTVADFTVLEGSEERPVVAFTEIEVPRLRSASRPAWDDTTVLDVVTNAPKDGRLVVIVFDRAIGAGWPADRARRIAARAVDELGPLDMAAVVYNDMLGSPINFTNDRARLLAAIQSPVLAVPSSDLGCFCGLCGLESLLLIARVLEQVREVPKMVLYIGRDVALFDAPGHDCAPYAQPLIHEMFRTLQRAQVPVHAIDPLGVRTPGAFRAENRTVGFGAGGRGPDYENLRRLAENTGGRVVVGDNRPDEVVPALFNESEVQYLIGFTPRTPPSRDPVQPVTVRVRRENVIILAPSGYRRALEGPASAAALDPLKLAAAAAASASARAVADLRPVPDIVMRVAVTGMPDSAQRDHGLLATVLGIELPVSDPAPITADVEVSAFDSNGRRHGVDKQTLTLTPTAGATMLVVDLLSKMQLRPGSYEIRAAVVTRSGKVGSVYSHVDVDNFARAPLAMSGLLLTASAAPRLVTTADPGAWLPLSPTTVRDFARTDRVTAAVRLVQPRQLASGPVVVETAIVDSTARRVSTTQAEIPPQAFSTSRVADYRVPLPIASLQDGDYLLTLTSTLGKTKITRTARFRIQ